MPASNGSNASNLSQRMTTEQTTILLSHLHPGQTGRIVRVSGQTATRRRLLELGLVRGELITVERVAPLGDPVEFTIKGYHLSLRRQNAAQVEVELANRGEGAG